MKEEKDWKPCEAACPKCGASDTNRQHREEGTSWNNSVGDYEARSSTYIHKGAHVTECLQECITHHCRVCHYEWETGVLV